MKNAKVKLKINCEKCGGISIFFDNWIKPSYKCQKCGSKEIRVTQMENLLDRRLIKLCTFKKEEKEIPKEDIFDSVLVKCRSKQFSNSDLAVLLRLDDKSITPRFLSMFKKKFRCECGSNTTNFEFIFSKPLKFNRRMIIGSRFDDDFRPELLRKRICPTCGKEYTGIICPNNSLHGTLYRRKGKYRY
jgi:Zn finger protein HypA/HybF involved in hydrogenase expression